MNKHARIFVTSRIRHLYAAYPMQRAVIVREPQDMFTVAKC